MTCKTCRADWGSERTPGGRRKARPVRRAEPIGDRGARPAEEAGVKAENMIYAFPRVPVPSDDVLVLLPDFTAFMIDSSSHKHFSICTAVFGVASCGPMQSYQLGSDRYWLAIRGLLAEARDDSKNELNFWKAPTDVFIWSQLVNKPPIQASFT